MSDVEKELRDMLRNKADDVLIDTDVPAEVMKRSRRRRAMTSVLAGVVGLGVVLGGFAGASALLNTDNKGELGNQGTTPPVAVEEWPENIWPDLTREEAEARQAEMDAGSGEYDWQLDPGELMRRYGLEVRMWSEVHFVDPALDYSTSPIEATIGSCAQQSSEAQGGSCEFALVRLEQPLGSGQGRLWFVTGDEPGDPGGIDDPEPGEQSVEAFVTSWMDARLAGSGAREGYLTEDSAALFDTHAEGGLYLYDGDVQGGQPEASFFDWFFQYTGSRGGTPETWDVVVVIEAGETREETDFTTENLLIGPGLRLDGSRGLVVRWAGRSGTVADDPRDVERQPCVVGSATPVRHCADAFMQNRVEGVGVEHFITQDARSIYQDPNNELHLYGTPHEDSGNFEFESYEVLGIRKADANSYEVDVRLHVVAEGGPMTIFETLFMGPGANENEELQDFVVRGAEGHYE